MKHGAVVDFLKQSNAIEKEYSEEALEDSVIAWEYAVGNYDDFGIDYICGIHKRLMTRLNARIAGKLRRKAVYIVGRMSDGERVIIREIEARGNKPRLRRWCEKYRTIGGLEEMKEAHIDFEMIHPFSDGNGRTGRILYNAQRVFCGFDVRVFREKEKGNYYKWFIERQRRDNLIEFLKNI